MAERTAVAVDLSRSSALHHMDMMRGVAAILVLAGHLRGLFFVDLAQVSNPSAVLRGLYVVTGFGHQAVVVFFVLSGFFIGTSVLGSRSRGTWSWSSYLLRRLTRLEVVLLPALLLTLLLDTAGMKLFGVDNIYGGNIHTPMTRFVDVRTTLGLLSFLGNASFLQYIFVQPYGTDGPLWSLGYEFWSYILFPLLVAVGGRRSTLFMRAAAMLLAAPIVAFAGMKFLTYFGMWMFGVGVSVVWRYVASRARVSAPLTGLTAGIFGVTVTAARVSHTHPIFWDYLASAATAMLLLVLLARGREGSKATYALVATRLASFSYTLYLVHFPILAFCNAKVIGVERWQPSVPRALFAVLLGIGTLALAYGIAAITESRTERVRTRLEEALGHLRSRLRSRIEKQA